jgi:hypothetical protein
MKSSSYERVAKHRRNAVHSTSYGLAFPSSTGEFVLEDTGPQLESGADRNSIDRPGLRTLRLIWYSLIGDNTLNNTKQQCRLLLAF